jgi:hypothetical protein
MPILDKMIQQSIPVSKAQFVKAVDNAQNTPEAGFDINSNVPGRRVEMYLSPIGLICKQGNQTFSTPLSNLVKVIFANEAE